MVPIFPRQTRSRERKLPPGEGIPCRITYERARFKEASAEFIVLNAILECCCVISEASNREFSAMRTGGVDYSDRLRDLLPDVLASTVPEELWNKCRKVRDFEGTLFDLSDAGFIAITESISESMRVSLPTFRLFAGLSDRRCACKLAWKDHGRRSDAQAI